MAHILPAIVTVASVLAQVWGHGAMIWPPQRGITNGFKFAHVQVRDPSAKSDWYAHFPAGDKATWPGAAMRSQKQAAGSRGWTPYNPFDANFKWRANVCGDLNWKNDHMRGGKYYNGGKIHATYTQGEAISVDLAIVAHHNGYIEMYVCDVARCGGEISKDCFRQRACYRLRRSWEPSCESRHDWRCAPMDPRNPSRWYLPCGKSGTPGSGVDIYGQGKIKFQLPQHLTCEHCVVQWYWVSANDCNPPGVVDYFKSDRHPFWGDCPGQGEALGGWRRWETQCGGHRFPEEYYTCADIRIKPKHGREKNRWQQPNKSNQQNNWKQHNKAESLRSKKLSARSRPRKPSTQDKREARSNSSQQQRSRKNQRPRRNLKSNERRQTSNQKNRQQNSPKSKRKRTSLSRRKRRPKQNHSKNNRNRNRRNR